jgi:prefoldin alpha subunit
LLPLLHLALRIMSSSSSSAQQPGVDVGDLSPQQLLDVRSQLQSELQHLTASYGQLRAAQLKFKGCLDALAALGPSAEGKETLVPLSASLYVPGRLRSTHTVIVDVGTGYFVEKVRCLPLSLLAAHRHG